VPVALERSIKQAAQALAVPTKTPPLRRYFSQNVL
jgi:hypothetical protein